MTQALLSSPPGSHAQALAVVGPAALRAQVLDALGGERRELCGWERLQDLSEAGLDRPATLIVLLCDGPVSARSSVLAEVRALPEASIVLVCASIKGWEVRAALAAGVAGIVLLSELSTALAACLSAVQAGQISLPHHNRSQIGRPVLSAREKQILGLVVMGFMNGQIAERLFLAESTVKSHLSSAFGKLEVHSRHEAVDLILDPERGLALGILALGGEPLELTSSAAR